MALSVTAGLAQRGCERDGRDGCRLRVSARVEGKKAPKTFPEASRQGTYAPMSLTDAAGISPTRDTHPDETDLDGDDGGTYGQGLPSIEGTVELASAEYRERRCLELLGDGALVVRVPSPSRAIRGRLEGYLDDAIEGRLLALGAAGPHPHTADKLGDQLFRARAIGAAGLVLSVDALSELRCPALTPEDSGTLATLAYATHDRPFVLLLDDDDRNAPAYGRPIPLVALLHPRLIATQPAQEAAPATISDPPRAVEASPSIDADHAQHAHEPPAPERTLETANGRPALPVVVEATEPEPMAETETPEESRPYVAVDRDVVLAHARALSDVRGPQPLAVLRSLFLSHYVPLGEMLFESRAYGMPVESRAATAFAGFRRSFERAYSDAFPTFALTGKRPKMVFDAFEEATRLARMAGARATSLLLVPSLRVDIGERAHEALAPMLPEDALVESGILFAALPTSSARQEDTLARGALALASPRPDESLPDPEWHARGALRRIRVGPRDLYSLDTVAAFRAQPHGRGPELVTELEALADGLAVNIARHAHGLVSGKTPAVPGRAPERTLLFVFGDHGFTFGEDLATHDGGASPEEVIVPYFAYALDPSN